MWKRKNQEKYYWKNREKILKHSREMYHKNKEKRSKQINEYERIRKKEDPNFKLKKDLRRLLNQAINYYEKTGVMITSKKYPIDFPAIITHLLPFPNRRKYQIDHIKPLCSFDLTDPKQLQIAFAPENHQWLKAEENFKKGRSLNWQ